MVKTDKILKNKITVGLNERKGYAMCIRSADKLYYNDLTVRIFKIYPFVENTKDKTEDIQVYDDLCEKKTPSGRIWIGSSAWISRKEFDHHFMEIDPKKFKIKEGNAE